MKSTLTVLFDVR